MEVIIGYLFMIGFLVWMFTLLELEPKAPDTEREDMLLDISSTEGADDWMPAHKTA